MHTDLQKAAAFDMLMEKEAILPALLAGGMVALGLGSAAYDIYEGVKNKSVGQALWGAAQVPLSFAGSGVIGAASKMPRLAGMLSKVPGLARSAGALERASTWAGGKMVSPLVKGLGAVGAQGAKGGLMRNAAAWGIRGLRNNKMMAGLTGAYMLGGSLFGGSGEQEAGQGGQSFTDSYTGPGAKMQSVENVAPSFIRNQTQSGQMQPMNPITDQE